MPTSLTKPAGQVLLADEGPRRRASDGPQAAFRPDIRRALKMHPGIFWLTFLIVAMLMVGYALTRKVMYQAEAVFFFSPVPTPVLPQDAPPSFDSIQYDAAFQQLMQTLQRLDTAEAAVRAMPEGVWRYPGEPVVSAARRLMTGLSVERTGTSFQLDATLLGPQKHDTEVALDALSKVFLREVHQEESGSSEDRLSLLREEAAKVATTLDEDRAEQAKLAAVIGVARLNETTENPLDANVDILKKQISDIRHARDLAGAGLVGGGDGIGDSGGEGGGVVTSTAGLISSLNARKALLQSQMAGMTSANPLYQIDQSELKNIDRELHDAVTRSEREIQERQDQRADHAVMAATEIEGRLRGELASRTASAVAAAPLLQRYAGLNSEINRLQLRLGITKDAMQIVSLQAAGPSRVRTAVPSRVSDAPESKRRNLVLVGALPLALFAGLIAVLLAHSRDPRVFLAGDLEKVLGFKPMAVLPSETEVSDAITDGALLKLASSIESTYLKNQSKTFVFTAANSVTQVEGLVFRVQNKLGDLGYSAVWIGAETLLRPEEDFEHLYGRGPSMKMADRYADGTTDGIAATRLAWLKRDYDMVLIDAPPLLNSAEAEYAIRRTDATILVSESGIATKADLQLAGETLERLGANGIGAVIFDLHLRYADPTLRRAIAKSEERAAHHIRRDPVDNAGAWQVLNEGTEREVNVPGDPETPRYLKRSRIAAARANRTSDGQRARKPSDSSGSVMTAEPISDEHDVYPDASSDEHTAYNQIEDDEDPVLRRRLGSD